MESAQAECAKLSSVPKRIQAYPSVSKRIQAYPSVSKRLIRISIHCQVRGCDCREEAKLVGLTSWKQILYSQTPFHLVGKNSKGVVPHIFHECSFEHIGNCNQSHEADGMSCKMCSTTLAFHVADPLSTKGFCGPELTE